MSMKVITLAVVLVLAACGGGETTDATDSVAPDAAPVTVAPADTDTVPAVEPDESIPPPDLIGINWNVVNIGLEGSFTNVWPGTEITLVFDSANSISGFSSCNDYVAAYEVEGGYRAEADPFDDSKGKGQVMRISDISATTDNTCEEKLVEQEADYFKDLRDTDRWILNERNLILVSNDAGLRVDAEAVE